MRASEPPGPRSVRAVIFDLDGTLTDSAAEIAAALEGAFRERGLAPLSLADVKALIGRGVRSLVQRALERVGGEAGALDAVVERFEAHYARTVGTSSALFPGVREGLERLHAAGYPLAVVTNKPRYFALRLLEALGVGQLFVAVIAGDDGIARKPGGDMVVAACRAMGCEPAAALMVGDSDNDIAAARAAGCPVWCVPYGYNEGRPPAQLACDRLVASIDEVARLLHASS